jgi:hypothetical protein
VLSAAEVLSMRQTVESTFDETMDVYTPDAVGRYTVTYLLSVPCRKDALSVQPAVSADGRRSLSEPRRITYPVDVLIPDNARLFISGLWWRPEGASHRNIDGITRNVQAVRVR